MKNKIFRIISIVMTLVILLTANVSAAPIYLGDMDGNSRVEASDARTILRAAVGLDTLTGDKNRIADTDRDGTLSSNDARTTLRMSVGLTEWIMLSDEAEKNIFEIHFIDVGQADCALVLCDGDTLLIDGGNTGDGDDIVSYLYAENITELDYVICTHAHEDHVGGLADVLDSFTVTEEIFAPATGATTKCYTNFITEVKEQNKEISVPEASYTFSLGESTVEILGPVTEDYKDINNTSIVTKITYGESTFLFTGDMEREAEEDLLEAGAELKADVLKVGHHGSENSTTYPFLREVMPEIAVISVGVDNDYGHPTEAALSRLRDASATVYRTDIQGHIILKSDGQNITVTTQKNQDAETNPTIPSAPDKPASPTEPAPGTPDSTGEYIGNINSKKLHVPTCSSLPKEENRIYFATTEAAKNAGYTACSRCKPF